MKKNHIQSLYQKVQDNKLSKAQFVLEVSKQSIASELFGINSYNVLVNALKKRKLITEAVTTTPEITKLDKVNFWGTPKKTYIVATSPKSIQYVHNDKYREVDPTELQEFISATYPDGTDNLDELSIATDFILHNQDKLDNYPTIKEDCSVDEIKSYKDSSIKVVQHKPTSIKESLTYDDVSSHEYNIGFSIEFDKVKDAIQASKNVLKNLTKNPSYYTNLVANFKKDPSTEPKKVTKSDIVDTNKLPKLPKRIHEIENLIGGMGDNKSDEEFDQTQLEMGIKHEMEHTNDRETAKEIAKDHLSEDPQYYTHLKKSGIDEYRQRLKEETIKYLQETGKPSAGLSKAEKSEIVKRAKAGKDFGKKGKGFEKVVAHAKSQGYDAETAKKIAGASFWKSQR